MSISRKVQEAINHFIEDEATKKWVENYKFSRSNPFEIGFNVFHLISDGYYKENFQSDIIAALLNPSHSHNEQNKYLHLFIDCLNRVEGKKIDKIDFLNSQVERETDKIDILIKDVTSKKAIIIESKLNGAADTYRQLPTYVEKLKKQNYDIEAIVYLTLESGKSPNQDGWQDREKIEIDTLLKKVSSTEFYDHWIIPSIINSTNIDSAFILRQYGNLLKNLIYKNMEDELLEKFYNSLGNDNLIVLKKMVDEFPNYLANKIQARYVKKYQPFNSVIIPQPPNSRVLFLNYKDYNLQIDCSYEQYTVRLGYYPKGNAPKGHDTLKDLAVKALEGFNYSSSDQEDKNVITKTFDINPEKGLYLFIDQFLKQISPIAQKR